MFNNNQESISQIFKDSLNKVYKLNLNLEQATIFKKYYFSLLDSYISFNERELNKKFISLYPSKYNYDILTEHFEDPKFLEIIEKLKKEKNVDIDFELVKIRNALKHDFWMYLSNDEINKLSKGNIKNYIINIIKKITPENVFYILEKIDFYNNKNNNEYKNQGEKFKEELKTKIIPSLKRRGIDLSTSIFYRDKI